MARASRTNSERSLVVAALTVLGLVLAIAGVVWAVAPYRVPIKVRQVLLGSAHPTALTASCSPSVVSIWHLHDKRDLQLWAVTDHEHFGTEVRGGQGRWCADEAGHRLWISGGLVIGGLVAVFGGQLLANRRRRSAQTDLR